MMDLDEFRSILNGSGVDVWTMIETAIVVASLDHGLELKGRRDRIIRSLYSEVTPVCRNCSHGGGDRRAVVEEKTWRPDKSVVVVENDGRRGGGRRDESPVTTPDFDEAEEAAEEERGRGREIHEEVEEGEQERRILAIKEQIEDPHQSEDALVELLQTLEDMDITFKALKETDIGRHVNHLRKHDSGEIRRVAKQLVRKWKDIVDDWVKRNKPGALPSSYVADGDSPELQGFHKSQPSGRPQVPDFGYSPNPHNGISASPEPEVRRQTAPARRDPPTKMVQSAPLPYSAPQPSNVRERAIDPDKLASARKRLHENYQEAENARKQRTIQVMEIHDIPKPKNARHKGGFHGRH
ncbi:putative mediator of RNA polymerase II transcription subunit 26c [Drosera capensis]